MGLTWQVLATPAYLYGKVLSGLPFRCNFSDEEQKPLLRKGAHYGSYKDGYAIGGNGNFG